MLDVVLAALRSRRSATIALCLLTLLVIAGATAAPCVLYAATDRVTALDEAGVPTTQRMVILSQAVTLTTLGFTGTTIDTSGVPTAIGQLRQALTIPGSTDIDTIEVDGSVGAPLNAPVEYAYRADVCTHVTLTGSCPAAVNEAIVSRGYAAAFNLTVGSTITWSGPAQGTAPKLRIAGIYQPLVPDDPYWGKDLLGTGQPAGAARADAVFVTEATLEADAPAVRCVRMLVITPAAIKTYGADRINRDITGASDLATSRDYTVDADFGSLAARIVADRTFATTAIGALAVELVVLGWFALYLVLRAIAVARRPDVGIHLLHGVRRRRIAAMAALQNALPVLVTLPFGVVAGFFGARLLTGPLPGDRDRAAAALAGVAVTAVLLGAVLTAAITERRASRASIPELLRNTPARRHGWRAAAVDLIVFAIAVTAVVQVRVTGGSTSSLAAAAPMLVAVAVAALGARLLAPAGRRFVASSLRRGRPAGVLTATYLARRHGLDRILILLIIAVAALGNALVSAHIASVARATRAVQELGADRIVELRGVTAAQVFADTHAADPAGHYLMAASSFAGGDVLAVDSPRLGDILATGGGWPAAAAIEHALAVPAPAATSFGDGTLMVTVAATRVPAAPVEIALDVVDTSGTPQTVTFGPITAGTVGYRAELSHCPHGCTVVDLRVLNVASAVAATPGPPVAGFDAVIQALGPADGPPAGTLAFNNRELWRTSGAIDVVGPTLTGAADGLGISLTGDSLSEEVQFDPRVFPIDAPLPLPAIVAGGAKPGGSTAATVQPFSDLTIPVRIAGTAAVLPQLGTAGMLVDLSDALRLDGNLGAGSTPQIWIRAGAPAAMVARVLAGRDVVSDRTLRARRDALADQAPAAVARFTLAVGVIALLVALIAMALMDSFERGVDLSALRRQGLTAGSVARTAFARHGIVVLAALLAGLAAVAAGRFILRTADPVFADGWRTPPAPHASATAWLLALGAAAVPLAVTAGWAARRLIARTAGAAR